MMSPIHNEWMVDGRRMQIRGTWDRKASDIVNSGNCSGETKGLEEDAGEEI